MAIDNNPLLQLLTQLQGGGGPPISPSSGLQDPSLSGLALGEQGMGLGGGGSLLGGGGGGIGAGTEGPGLDLLSLLNQVPPMPSGGGLQPTLGQAPFQFPSFGAGGQLTKGSQIGQSGMGGGGLMSALSTLLKSGQPISKLLKHLLTPAGIGAIPPDVATGADIATGGLGTFGTQLGGSLGQTVPSDVAAGADIATGGLGATGALPAVSGTDLLGAGGVFGETAAPAASVAGGLGASLPTLGADATSTVAGFAGALSPVSTVLSLLSLADLFGAPGLGIGNIFKNTRINDLNAAQTEAAIRQAVAGAKAGGPIETNFAQRGLDAQLIASVFPDLTPVGALPETVTPLERQLQGILAGVAKTGPFVPGATLDPSLLAALQAVNPSAFNAQAEAQRRYRTLAGFPFLAPPPAIESAIDPRGQAFSRPEDPLAFLSA